MCVHGSQAACCTTELCLPVDKLKEEGKNREGTMSVHRGNVYVVYILSTVKTENTYTRARLEALVQKLSVVTTPRPSSFLPLVPLVPSRIQSPSFFGSDCVRNPSRCFVRRSAVLFFVSTRLTDRRLSRTHCCIAKHRISMCLSPLGPLRCRMCRAESESISRRTATS